MMRTDVVFRNFEVYARDEVKTIYETISNQPG